jgi:isoleucyl-tRNA synthetase
LRKECDFEVTDKIKVRIESNEDVADSLQMFSEYVCAQTLALSIELVEGLTDGKDVEWGDATIKIDVNKMS